MSTQHHLIHLARRHAGRCEERPYLGEICASVASGARSHQRFHVDDGGEAMGDVRQPLRLREVEAVQPGVAADGTAHAAAVEGGVGQFGIREVSAFDACVLEAAVPDDRSTQVSLRQVGAGERDLLEPGGVE